MSCATGGNNGNNGNLLYPCTIAVHRSRTNAVGSGGVQQVGLTGYAGREQTTVTSDLEGEVVLYTGLPANIVAMSGGRVRNVRLPSDATEYPQWRISLPASALPRFSIRDRDLIVDDEFCRYEVMQNFWTILGYQLVTVRLEA